MKETFSSVLRELLPITALTESLYSFVFAWSEDYECQRYIIYSEIPQEAKYFWANRFGKYLYKFERTKDGWKLVEKSSALTFEGLKRIRRGPAFKEVPPVLESWEHLWPE